MILQGAAVLDCLEHILTGSSAPGDLCRDFCNFSPVHGRKAHRKLQRLMWILKIIKAIPTLFSPSPPPIIFFPFSGMQACRERLLSFYGGSQLWLFEVLFLTYWHGFTRFFSQKKKKKYWKKLAEECADSETITLNYPFWRDDISELWISLLYYSHLLLQE